MSNLPENQDPPDPEPIRILDQSDPLSVINILPAKLRPFVEKAVAARPELFQLSEEDFIRHCKSDSVYFNSTDHMIRDQFWIEYHHARSRFGRGIMAIGRILTDAISYEGFFGHYAVNHYKMAWILTMPLSYRRILERNLSQLARNVQVILDEPLKDPVTGKIDKGLAQLQASLFKFHEVTLHGTPTQRTEQKIMSLQVTRHESGQVSGRVEGLGAASQAQRIKELESRLRRAQHVPKLAEWQKTPAAPNPGVSMQSPPAPADDKE